MEREQEHFRACLELIRENINRYEQKTEAVRKETEELYAAVASGEVELYNQLVVSRDIQEHNENILRKNRAALQKPYFGRIDYREQESGQEETLYIGKNGISRTRTEVAVIDWRAPVSALYYESELGEGCYPVPDIGEIPVELRLKRTFDIQQGKLLGYYDNDTAATDELLVKYLSQNKEVILGDIISTIQKEQNEIIRETPFADVIVQGVAGSGKTTVAMHRISYILYNYEKRFTPSEFCIIGSSDILLHYITSGLPELDVHHVGQKRMDLFFRELLGKEWKKTYELAELREEEAWKSRLDFAWELEDYLQKRRARWIPTEDIRDPDLGVILSGESIRSTLEENRNASIVQIFRLLNERIQSRIKFLAPEGETRMLKEKKKEYRGYFKLEAGQKNLLALYLEFLEAYRSLKGDQSWEKNRRMQGQKASECGIQGKGKLDVYDLAALVLIQTRVSAAAFHDEYGQIIIDEAQDFGPMVYYVLRQVLHQCYFTIMGDVSQNINYETGMNHWDDLTEHIFADRRMRFHVLAKSYRNTIEISKYAGRVLERASFGAYKINPVIRHGREAAFYETEDTGEAMARQGKEIIRKVRERSFDTIAVICRSEKEAETAASLLGISDTREEEAASLLGIPDTGEEGTSQEFQKGVMVLPVRLTKGLEFDAVILWNPTGEAYRENEGDAKLLYVAITRALHELHVVYAGSLTGLLKAVEE